MFYSKTDSLLSLNKRLLFKIQLTKNKVIQLLQYMGQSYQRLKYQIYVIYRTFFLIGQLVIRIFYRLFPT